MTFRHKLLLAQMPMTVALLLIVAGSIYACLHVGSAPAEILHENFRSFDAGRGMANVVDAVEEHIFEGSQSTTASYELGQLLVTFERELTVQESNITEEGESEATARLHQAWETYRDGLALCTTPAGLTAHRVHAAVLRDAVEAILQMNRDAMHRKSERTRRGTERIVAVLAAAATFGFFLATFVTGFWLRRTLAPIRVLERAVHRLAQGDFATRIVIQGDDEIASLSRSFNDMAERLSQYRQSSLGDLLNANNRLESVMDSLADAVVVYDLDGTPATHNEVAIRLLGPHGIALETLPEALQVVVREAFEQVRRTAEAYEHAALDAAVEIPGTPTPRWILVSATPVRTMGGTPSGVTIAFRDVTRSRRIEGFKGDLVAGAAHEFRTPLTSLHMAIHLCLEEAAGPLNTRQQDLLVLARRDCERLESVVEELLEMARLESGAARLTRTSVNVADFVREAIARHKLKARNAGTSLTGLRGDSLVTISADPGRLTNVLDNLIENAMRYAGHSSRIEVGHEATNGDVRIFVDDDGPGIPPDLRERVFARFFRVPGSAEPGTGLGLSIVQDIVRAHGGRVGVSASPLGGARFWFSIPIHDDDEAETGIVPS